MPVSRIKRGLQDVRTLAGTVDQTFMPHKAMLRIACLEMEKERRQQERRSALRRVASIDSRFADIEAEKGRLSRALEEHGEKCLRVGRSEEAKSRGMTPLGSRGFKFRY